MGRWALEIFPLHSQTPRKKKKRISQRNTSKNNNSDTHTHTQNQMNNTNVINPTVAMVISRVNSNRCPQFYLQWLNPLSCVLSSTSSSSGRGKDALFDSGSFDHCTATLSDLFTWPLAPKLISNWTHKRTHRPTPWGTTALPNVAPGSNADGIWILRPIPSRVVCFP